MKTIKSRIDQVPTCELIKTNRMQNFTHLNLSFERMALWWHARCILF